MPARPEWPSNVYHLDFEVEDNGYPASFGLWLLWEVAGPSDSASAGIVLTDFVTNLLHYFTDLMHSAATFRVFRLTTMRPSRFRWVSMFPPNAGGLSGGVTLARAAGVYVQGNAGGKGSGTRIRVPGIGAAIVDPPGKLNELGVQKLQFLSDALAAWPTQLALHGGGPVLLGTLQTKRGRALLDPPAFDPAVSVRPSFLLETVVRRARSFERLSSS